MRRAFLRFLLPGGLAACPQATAAPGDTTRVAVFNERRLFHYGAFDTASVLPASGRYREILLHYVLGRYAYAGEEYTT